MKKPHISIIVPTYNSRQVLEACLQSVQNQTYQSIELIVVDNNSTDDTKAIARRFTDKVYNRGPERSAQRNFGVKKAAGDYVVIIDSDMQLTPRVIEACVAAVTKNPKLKGLVIPEESFGQGFWAQCKRLERSFYVGVPWIEAARFFARKTYLEAGGYDITLVSGEDWDLARRVERIAEVGRIDEVILHNEGRINLTRTLRKKYYYAQHAKAYLLRNPERSKLSAPVGPIQRYILFFSRPQRLLRQPLLGLGMLFMKTAEFAYGAVGYVRTAQTAPLKIADIFRTYDLQNSLLVGYYGGGNYGDELLLEALQNLFAKNGVTNASIAYRDAGNYGRFHHNLGYRVIDTSSKLQFVRSFASHRTIVIGGGGLWGLDTNLNILFLSLLLFVSRWCLGKRILLVGVGYYASTSRLGRISAWFAGKAAIHIIARDDETQTNFRRINCRTSRDTDIAWYIPQLDLSAYQEDLVQLEKQIRITGKTLFITVRRFQAKYANNFNQLVEQCLEQNQTKRMIVGLMEPRSVDPEGWALLQSWQGRYPQVQIVDFAYNPLALFLLFGKYRDQLVFMGPQFHAIITTHLQGVPFLPIAYDNKVVELLRHIGYKQPLSLYSAGSGELQKFIDMEFNGHATTKSAGQSTDQADAVAASSTVLAEAIV